MKGSGVMALVACRECDQRVSSEAVTCPHCGVSRPASSPAIDVVVPSRERPELLTLLLALIAAGVAISLLTVLWK
jgi:hypothetical protein